MATAALSGKEGSVTGVGTITEVKRWNCAIRTALLDATSMASAGWEEFIMGLQGASGSIVCVGNEAPDHTAAIATLSLKSDGTNKFTIAGAALLSNVNFEVDHAGIVTMTADFSFTGEVTVTTA